MKIMTVVGARPNFMKAAPLITAINAHNRRAADGSGHGNANGFMTVEHKLVHTGQHYDEIMSGSFFTDLGLPKPDVHLGIGSGSHASQTAEIMKKFESVLMAERPDVVVVVGDVNSTVACALVTAKISFDSKGARPLVAHVEAGLRSFDREMPEEVNRVVTDHVSDLLFVTEESGLINLRNEGVSADHVHFVGNTMIDSLLAFKEKADSSNKLDELELRGAPGSAVRPYALLTLHRPSNVDNPVSLRNILDGILELRGKCPVIFPVHPRTQTRIKEFGIRLEEDGLAPARDGARVGIKVIDPLGYLDFLCLMKNARIVVTDSGGIQEETTCLGVPCVTVRENTERPVTVVKGTNVIAGTSQEGIRNAIRQQSESIKAAEIPAHWDGKAATRILEVLVRAMKAPVGAPVLV